jgi:hypothetical protein
MLPGGDSFHPELGDEEKEVTGILDKRWVLRYGPFM